MQCSTMRQQAQGGRHAGASTATTAASYFRAITTRAMSDIRRSFTN
jgi:hypothetical protein